MKFHNLTYVALALTFACSSPKTESNTESETVEETKEEVVAVEEKPAVCIWDNISVRETPSAKGKWLTSISLGESLTYVGLTAIDSSDKNREYMKVQLNDGTEGWSAADFIIPEGEIGVFLEETFIYNRPDLLTKSDKMYERLDIIAVQNTQDDWQEVIGKRSEGKWIDSGWIKKGKLSFKPIDIAAAKFLKDALSKDTEEESLESLNMILENPDLKESSIMTDVRAAVNEISGVGEEMMLSDTLTEVSEEAIGE
ncbi:SH3 domain-containing protein [Marinoscillum pacificum]|uniref:SH3 domain-containing protein n=1 Tax=Marinoscillum pacificum TaxID=392723 RepID=UPI00215775AA|nr:SH3 domain-containing protein [Marinoscillum pacificum]